MKLSAIKRFWRRIELTEQVSENEELAFSFSVQFERLPISELKELSASDPVDLLKRVIKDFSGLDAESSNEPLPFSGANLDALLNVAGMPGVLFDTYLNEVGNLRRKN